MTDVAETHTWGWTARGRANMALIVVATSALHLPFQYYVSGLSFSAAVWMTVGVAVGGLSLGLAVGYRAMSVDDDGVHLHPVLPWRATVHHPWEAALDYSGGRLELPRMTGWYTPPVPQPDPAEHLRRSGTAPGPGADAGPSPSGPARVTESPASDQVWRRTRRARLQVGGLLVVVSCLSLGYLTAVDDGAFLALLGLTSTMVGTAGLLAAPTLTVGDAGIRWRTGWGSTWTLAWADVESVTDRRLVYRTAREDTDTGLRVSHDPSVRRERRLNRSIWLWPCQTPDRRRHLNALLAAHRPDLAGLQPG